jgi:hypothetical protein
VRRLGRINILESKYYSKGGENINILWMSRHLPLASQKRELAKLFGDDVIVEQDSRPFSSAEEIVSRYKSGGYDEMIVVAPLSVVARLVDLGIRPLWVEMIQIYTNDGAEVTIPRRDGRTHYYVFDRFRRVTALRLEFEEL